MELEGLKGVLTKDTFEEPAQREDAKKTIKKAFEERYSGGKNRWFFAPLSQYSFSIVGPYSTALEPSLEY